MIVKWYNNPELLSKYISLDSNIEGVMDIVEELSEFISDNNLDQLEKDIIVLSKIQIASKITDALAINSEGDKDQNGGFMR